MSKEEKKHIEEGKQKQENEITNISEQSIHGVDPGLVVKRAIELDFL